MERCDIKKRRRENEESPFCSCQSFTAAVGRGGAHITDFCAFGRRPVSLLPQGRHATNPSSENESRRRRKAWCELMRSRWWKGYRPLAKHRRPNKAEPGVRFKWKEASPPLSGSTAAGFDVRESKWQCGILMVDREQVTDTNQGHPGFGSWLSTPVIKYK